MIIKYFDETIKAPTAVIRDRIVDNSRLVKFGPLDFFNTKYENFTEPWMGEFDAQLNEFKLFKTIQGTDETSEFYIKGRLLDKFETTSIRYSVNVHYMFLVGLLGLNVFGYSVFYLLQTKGLISISWIWIPTNLIFSGTYIGYKLKDYLKTISSFKDLISIDNKTA